MDTPLPLSALLSQALVAFIIEFDNEFEHRIPHRTTDHGLSSGGAGPWLVSMAMWENCMRHIGDGDMTKARVEALARTTTNWDGMRRWGYIRLVEGDRSPSNRSGIMIRATSAGKKAQAAWRPLTAEISQRWHIRFGADTIHSLTSALQEIDHAIGLPLPDCLPILGYGLFTRIKDHPPGRQSHRAAQPPNLSAAQPSHRASAGPPQDPGARPTDHSLPTLLSRVLLAFALEYEQHDGLSLAISANILRVLTADGIPLRDIVRLAGVSAASVSMAMGILRKGWVIEGPNASGRGKAVGLTDKGFAAQSLYAKRAEEIEKRWEKIYGAGLIKVVRSSLETLVGNGLADRSPLFRGINPYPDGWRAKIPKPEILPHFPMILHRGGFPDGS